MPSRALRRTLAAIVLVVAALSPAVPVAAPARPSTGFRLQAAGDAPWVLQLRAYVGALAEHRPGIADMSAQTIGSWSEGNLDAVRFDLRVLQSICLRGTGRARMPAGVVSRRESSGVRREDASALLGLAGALDPVHAITLMLQRGAVLHADIAMLVTPFRFDRVGCSARSPVTVIDGQAVGTGCSNYHWRLGRELLDELQPDPSADLFARLWYRATITFLLERTNYSDALPQITRARARFPNDGVLQFEHGYYQESLSAPRVQALSGADRGTLRSERTYLEAAESSFRRAVTLDPTLVEARVRLGAVLTRLEHYRDALAVLQPALDGVQDPVLRYYGELFLARASEGLGNLPAARDHYERAGAAVPSAEAPLLALGRLARSAGDRARAAELVRRATTVQGPAGQPEDPWWIYNRWQSRNSASLLRELRQSIEPGGRP